MGYKKNKYSYLSAKQKYLKKIKECFLETKDIEIL